MITGRPAAGRRTTCSGRRWRWRSAVAIIAALSLLVSVLLSVTAKGIVVFMVFGAGLTAGLLAQIGHAIDSDSLHTIGRVASWALPFEGLYAAGLHALISNTSGLTGVVLQLGPFGGSEAAGFGLIAWAFVYMLGRACPRRSDFRPARPLSALSAARCNVLRRYGNHKTLHLPIAPLRAPPGRADRARYSRRGPSSSRTRRGSSSAPFRRPAWPSSARPQM